MFREVRTGMDGVGVDYTQESKVELFGALAREFGVEPPFVEA
jgi:hypothetical protein